MSKFLIVAATSFEIQALLDHFNYSPAPGKQLTQVSENLSVLITGVGMVNTAYSLARERDIHFDFVINAGVCGHFKDNLKTGDLVEVIEDTFSELGAEDHNDFIPFNQMGLGGTATYYPKNRITQLSLPQVMAITVNTVHGNTANIQTIIARYQPDIESMEGAAFFRACEHMRGECIQVRAVSNLVEKRDKNKWNMPLAIAQLNNFLIQFIDSHHD